MATMNNNRSEVYSPTTRCGYKFFNNDSAVDKTALDIAYWNGLMKLTFLPIITKDDGSVRLDVERKSDVYLTPTKALQLLHYFKVFRENPKAFQSAGVPIKGGICMVSPPGKTGNTKNAKNICILAMKVDETGEITNEFAYEFTSNSTVVVNYTGGKDFETDDSYAVDMELDVFEKILATYVESSTSAMAASVLEANKYNSDRDFSFMKDVRTKLGIQQPSSTSNSYNRGSYSIFTANSGSSNGGSTGSTDVPVAANYDEMLSEVEAMLD